MAEYFIFYILNLIWLLNFMEQHLIFVEYSILEYVLLNIGNRQQKMK